MSGQEVQFFGAAYGLRAAGDIELAVKLVEIPFDGADGQNKPLVPNVTAGNRQKNRRVQFIILEQDPETPKKK